MPDHFEYIDDYFHQLLSAEEAKQFEQKIVADRDFAEEVAFYLSAKAAVKGQSVVQKKEWFKQLLQENDPYVQKNAGIRKLWTYRISAVAALMICLFLTWYMLSNKHTSSQMADTYVLKNLQTLPVTMGSARDSIQDGLRLYNQGRYDSAINQFESIVQKDTANYLAKKYLGICYLKVANYDKSLLYFRQLENYSLFSNPAKFYQALTLLKRNQPGDKQDAKQLLQQVVDGNLEGKETAQQWLKNW